MKNSQVMSMNNILITSAGRRVSLIRAFRYELAKYFSNGKVLTVDMNPQLSSACMASDGYFKVPAVSESDYKESLMEICRLMGIKLIIPTIDSELLFLAENKDWFIENGIIPVISDLNFIQICRDKKETHKFFKSIDIPYCKEIDLNQFKFPLFAKPYNGSSSIGTQLIRNEIELSSALKNENKLIFMEYVDPREYHEFTIDMYFDKNSNLKCAVPRQRIEIRTGEVSKSVTRKNILYDYVCSRFKDCKGLKGCITAQVFLKIVGDEVIGIEINPRFGGGYPLSYRAGANFPEMLIKEYMLNEEISFCDNWKSDVLMLRFDDEIIINDYKG